MTVPNGLLLFDVAANKLVPMVPPAENLISWSAKVTASIPSVEMMGAPPLIRMRHQTSGAAAPEASTPLVGENESLR